MSLLILLVSAGCGGRGDAPAAEAKAPAAVSADAAPAGSASADSASAGAASSEASSEAAADAQADAQGADGQTAEQPQAETAADAVVEPASFTDTSAPLATGAFASKALLPPQRLEIPSISLDTSVVQLGWSLQTLESGEIASAWEEADNAAGWHKNSAKPGFGENVVLSGHNNIMGAVFRELDLLKRGDPIYLTVDNLKFDYVVDKVLIVPEKFASEAQKQKNFTYIEPTGDERLTLVSCWPRDDNTHRIIVIARPVKSEVIG